MYPHARPGGKVCAHDPRLSLDVEPSQRVYPDRAPGGDLDHRCADRLAPPRRPGGPRSRAPGSMLQQPQANRLRFSQLPPTQQRLPGRRFWRKLGLGCRCEQQRGSSHAVEQLGAALLPFVEQTPLFNSINQSRWYLNPENLTAGQTSLSVYLCPTNQFSSLTRPNGDTITGPSIYGRNDYSGNYGERAVRCFPGTSCPNDYSDLGDKSGAHRGVTLTPSEPINTITTITDGTTYTIVVGEAHEAEFGMWIGHKNFLDQSAPINARNGLSPGTVWASCQVAKTSRFLGKLGCDLSQEFASYHAGGAAFAFADGSARFLKESINNKVLAALLSRKGGEIVNADAL